MEAKEAIKNLRWIRTCFIKREKHFLGFLFLLTIFLISGIQTFSQEIEKHYRDTIKIDKITVEKNWMTWDLIILNELQFKEGDVVRYGQIDTSIINIWNIGNFVDVDYSINETDTGNFMEIKALDAIKFYPLISIDHSSEDDYNYSLGYGDDNFLGSNSRLNIQWNKNPTGVAWSFNFNIPRQLMYKNMTLGFGFVVGNEIKRNLDRIIIYDTDHKVESVEYIPSMLAPIKKIEFYGSIGNPWHLDYKYRFSPNFSFRYMRHETDNSLLSPEDLEYGVEVDPYNSKMLALGFGESVGKINRKRHRADGYSIGVYYGIVIGLNSDSPNFHSFGINAQYHKIFNRVFQFSSWMRTGYTTADIPYRHIGGSSNVLGLRHGEIYGKSYYSAYAGAHFTWINKNWLALENAYFVNWGAGSDAYFGLYTKRPKMAIGSSFRFQVPIAPLLSIKITFMYAGPGSEWFKFNL